MRPSIICEMDFETLVNDTPRVWTDLTSRVRQVSFRRGKSYYLDAAQPGSATVVLDNRDGALSPSNTVSTYYGSIGYPKLVPMRPLRLRTWGAPCADASLFTGYVERWGPDFTRYGDAVVLLTCVDALAVLRMIDFSASLASHRVDLRIVNILASISPTFLQTLDVSISDVQATIFSNANVQSAIQQAVDVELGNWYVDGSGYIIFKNRHARTMAAVAAYFGGPLGLPYVNAQVDQDSSMIFNAVTVERTGGTAQSASDGVSDIRYFTRGMSRSQTQHVSDAEALLQATFIANRQSEPRYYVSSVTMRPGDSTAQWKTLLPLDFGSCVQVTYREPGSEERSGAADTLVSVGFIDGISMNITENCTKWDITYTLSPDVFSGFWILGYSRLGQTTILGY